MDYSEPHKIQFFMVCLYTVELKAIIRFVNYCKVTLKNIAAVLGHIDKSDQVLDILAQQAMVCR